MAIETFPAPSTVFRVGMGCLGAPLFDVAQPNAVGVEGAVADLWPLLHAHAQQLDALQTRLAVLEAQVQDLQQPWWRRVWQRLWSWWEAR